MDEKPQKIANCQLQIIPFWHKCVKLVGKWEKPGTKGKEANRRTK
jgi:hypothetical protein